LGLLLAWSLSNPASVSRGGHVPCWVVIEELCHEAVAAKLSSWVVHDLLTWISLGANTRRQFR